MRERAYYLAKIAALTVVASDPDDCYGWNGAFSDKGYAKYNSLLVSRVLLDLSRGDGLQARHKCDNPSCVNVRHLIPGSHAQNMQDMVDRQRQPRGEKRKNAKLNREIVTAVRLDARSSNAIARELGVSADLITKIKLGVRWRHVPMPDGNQLPTRHRFNDLTVRQAEVFSGLQRGLSHREVAVELGVTIGTVAALAMKIRRKGYTLTKKESGVTI